MTTEARCRITVTLALRPAGYPDCGPHLYAEIYRLATTQSPGSCRAPPLDIDLPKNFVA